MKQFKLEVSHASPAQLATIALELKIMSQWMDQTWPQNPDQWLQASSSKPQDTRIS